MDTAAILDEIATITGEDAAAERVRQLRYLNKYYKQLEFLTRLPALIKDDVIEVPIFYNTGTVAVTNGSATVTGTGTTFDTSVAGWFFTIQGSARAYRVSTRDNATQLTLEDNWEGATGTLQNYWLYKVEYTLPADFNRIISISQGNEPLELRTRSITQMNNMLHTPFRRDSGQPRYATIYSNAADYDNESTTQLSKIIISPMPDDNYQVFMRYFRHLPKLTDSAAVYPVFDDARLDEYLVDRTCARVFLDKEDNRGKVYKDEATESLLILKAFFEDTTVDDDRFMLQSGTLDYDEMVDRVSRDTNI